MVEVASCYGKEATVARLQGLCPLRSVSLPSVSPPLRTASPRVSLPEAHIVPAQFADEDPSPWAQRRLQVFQARPPQHSSLGNMSVRPRSRPRDATAWGLESEAGSAS